MVIDEFLKERDMTQGELASELGVSQGLVSHWVTERKQIQPEEALALCEFSAWRIRPHDLRPDIWPNPSDALPKPRKAA